MSKRRQTGQDLSDDHRFDTLTPNKAHWGLVISHTYFWNSEISYPKSAWDECMNDTMHLEFPGWEEAVKITDAIMDRYKMEKLL